MPPPSVPTPVMPSKGRVVMPSPRVIPSSGMHVHASAAPVPTPMVEPMIAKPTVVMAASSIHPTLTQAIVPNVVNAPPVSYATPVVSSPAVATPTHPPMVMHSNSQPTPMVVPGQAPSQLQIMVQMFREQIQTQFKSMKAEMLDQIDKQIKDSHAATLRNFKTQFENTEIVGETLNENIPVFSRPDPKTNVEHTIVKRGTKIKLFLPFTSNQYGYWATTPFLKSNGTVLTGYIPIFSGTLPNVVYNLSEDDMTKRREEWQGHLDQLCDKNFIPNVGRFQISV
jgi:hypothetical protein